jgi:arylsulfatase A-like enzyme
MRVAIQPVFVLVPLLAIVAGCSVGAEKPRDSSCQDCNVLFISIDTLRADHLGCYGYKQPTSPNIDRFAAESVLFSDATAHAPSTEPSHASMFTSLLPVHHGGLRAKHRPVSEKVRMMAEILKDAGLRTVSFNGGGQVAASYGFDRGFEIYDSSTGRFADKVGKAVLWLQNNKDQRFFMFLHTYEVHAPYAPAARHMELFDAGYTGNLPDEIMPKLLIDINDGVRHIDEQDARHIVAAYDAGIHSVDAAFGALHNYLKKSGLLDKTIVIFTSDHGEELGEHGQMGRHSHALYDELLHVPLIIRLPGGRVASGVIDELVRGIDLLPTVTELLGLASLEQFSGTSLVPLLGRQEAAPRLAISQLDSNEPVLPASVRTKASKLILGTQRFVADGSQRCYETKVELPSRTNDLNLPIEAFREPKRLRISAGGKQLKEVVIWPRKQPLSVPFATAEERLVTIESVTPCTSTAGDPTCDLPCASFRVFNPFEFFRLDRDPGEQQNLFDDKREQEAIAGLKRQLEAALASRPAADEPAEARVDPETRERLRGLGYVE